MWIKERIVRKKGRREWRRNEEKGWRRYSNRRRRSYGREGGL